MENENTKCYVNAAEEAMKAIEIITKIKLH